MLIRLGYERTLEIKRSSLSRKIWQEY